MGNKINRECIICKAQYHYCPTCGGDSSKPTWYFIFDGQNCHDIYEVCTQYRDKVINAEEAYEIISKLDITNIENFVDVTKAQIEEIIKLHEEAVSKPIVEEKKLEVNKEFNKAANNTNYVKNYKKK